MTSSPGFLGRLALLGLRLVSVMPQPAAALSRPLLEAGSRAVISEGQWRGTMLAIGSGAADVTKWNARWKGSMDFSSSDSALAGTFGLFGDLNLEMPNGSGMALYAGGGSVKGSDDQPMLVLEAMNITGALNVSGVSVPIVQTLGPEDFTRNVRVTLLSGTCNVVSGDWTSPVMGNFAASGISSDISGHWTAVRIADLRGEDTEAYLAEIGDLMQKMLEWQVITQVVGFNFTPLMIQTLDQADDLNRRLARGDECDNVDEKAFTTVISGIVATVIQFALEHPEGLNNSDLLRLTSIGIRMGVLGSGSDNPDLAADLKTGILELASKRIEEAEETPDCALVFAKFTGLEIAALLGDSDLREAAAGVTIIEVTTCSE